MTRTNCNDGRDFYLILVSALAVLRVLHDVRQPKVHAFRAYGAHEPATSTVKFCHKHYIHLISATDRRERPRPAVSDAVSKV